MSAESPRHARCGAPVVVAPQPPSERSIIDALSGFINDVTLASNNADPKDVIQWARFETADANEPVPEGEGDNDVSPLILILGYGSGVQVWLIPPNGEAQEVLSWRQGTVRVLRILPTPQHGDCFASKRPLIALCDSASPGPTFCSLSFISIRGGEQVKSIKFKNPILDVLANKRSIVVSFSERFAVFDAATLEDRMAITTCYPCPCPLGGNSIVNPLALGERWLAFADKKLNPSKRSGGGCEGDGVTSYTASVLHAAKCLSAGLRGLGESVAQSLGGARSTSQSPSPPHDQPHPGVVTVIDLESIEEEETQDEEPYDPLVAHFVAHSESIIAMKFDASGMILVTADRRGHDFHVFRINPHPCGPSQASVHHLYVLHRGDTTAKVQDIAISGDCRWAAISSLRGTTHIFAMSPYGGACGVRTHAQPRLVNRLSRFQRSAGLPIPTTNQNSPKVSDGIAHGAWFPNPRLPPYPAPTVNTPLAQLRPTANLPTHTITRTSSGRQRLSSLSEDSNSVPLLARACFGPAGIVPTTHQSAHKTVPVSALYLVSASGTLTHLMLHPRPAKSIPKEKICDDSMIELDVSPVAAWALQRNCNSTTNANIGSDLVAPLPATNPLLRKITRCVPEACLSEEERWLSQVEIVTHAGPHRRLWMGPQFLFKTFNLTGGGGAGPGADSDAEEVEVSRGAGPRSTPVNMPRAPPPLPVLVHSGSASSLEHSPSEGFRRKSVLSESGRAVSVCDVQLKEDLAEAMKEDHGGEWSAGSRCVSRCVDPLGTVVVSDNADEAAFRPVLRAPASAPPPPLPLRDLAADVVIPAELARLPDHHSERARDDHEPVTYRNSPELAADANKQASVVDQTLPRSTEHTQAIAPRETLPRSSERLPVNSSLRKELTSDVAAARRKSPTPELTASVVSAIRKSPTPESRAEIAPPIRKSPTPKLGADFAPAVRKSPTPEIAAEVASAIRKSPKPEYRTAIKGESETDGCGDNFTEKIRNVRNKSVEKTVEEKEDVKAVKREVELKPTKEKKVKETKPKIVKAKDVDVLKLTKAKSSKTKDSFKEIPLQDVNTRESPEAKDEQSITVSLPALSKKQTLESMSSESYEEIKTEEQAWDMLLNEPEKRTVLNVSQPVVHEMEVDVVAVDDSKPKSKKNKQKKALEACQSKSDEDSFVEIHAIEDKVQQSSSELVSIPDPLDEKHVDLEPSITSYTLKSKKSRSSNSVTPDKIVEDNNAISFDKPLETKIDLIKPQKPSFDALKAFDSNISLKPKAYTRKKNVQDVPTSSSLTETLHEPIKSNKSKSLSPLPDSRKQADSDKTDVYVIDTAEMNFPEIQVTKAFKTQKNFKSPQPAARKSLERETAIDKPIKSWSTIAASKKTDYVNPTSNEELTFQMDDETNEAATSVDVSDEKLFTEISLQDKLMQLCKRTDIIVAECDVPSELMFVDEHHTMLHELPPLEPLEFGLDDFKLEVMRDSLLDVDDRKITSPICKINIDDILSSLKENSTKVPGSCSAFNLIDLEKVPAKKEKGFSVIENVKITSQEVKVDTENKQIEEKEEAMEKSSDDDNTSPVVSTDSDKEDRKNTGASNTLLPLSKQSAKSKKSRRKKK